MWLWKDSSKVWEYNTPIIVVHSIAKGFFTMSLYGILGQPRNAAWWDGISGVDLSHLCIALLLDLIFSGMILLSMRNKLCMTSDMIRTILNLLGNRSFQDPSYKLLTVVVVFSWVQKLIRWEHRWMYKANRLYNSTFLTADTIPGRQSTAVYLLLHNPWQYNKKCTLWASTFIG